MSLRMIRWLYNITLNYRKPFLKPRENALIALGTTLEEAD